MSKFSEVFDKCISNYSSSIITEIIDNSGKQVDNVKINDIVKTPDGFIGKYIKKKEYAIIDLGNGDVKEAEINTLQLVEPAEEDNEEEQK